jgi:hypothetical protein
MLYYHVFLCLFIGFGFGAIFGYAFRFEGFRNSIANFLYGLADFISGKNPGEFFWQKKQEKL